MVKKTTKASITYSEEEHPEYGKISKLEFEDKSLVYISKKGWTLVTPDEKEILLPWGEISCCIAETIRQGYWYKE